MFTDIKKQISIKEALNTNTEREQLYCFDLSKNLYTQGIKQMNDLCNSQILVKDILIQCKELSSEFGLIQIIFKYIENIPKYKAVIFYEDGNKNIIAKKLLEYTDFPLQEITLFYENNTLFLPSER